MVYSMEEISNQKKWLKKYPLDVKIKLCQNRIEALEYDIKKRQYRINELKHFVKRFIYNSREVEK